MTVSTSWELLGVCLDQLVVIVEYCSGGNLLNYLRNSRTDAGALTLNRQLNMALQVAVGMEYLASKQVLPTCTGNILCSKALFDSHIGVQVLKGCHGNMH